MRILRRILIVLAFLVAALLLMGVMFPLFTYNNETVVNSSPEKCWRIYADTATMHQWIPGFESMILTKGQWWQKGSRYQFTITDGERMGMEQSITEVHPNSSISYLLKNDVLQSEYTVSFEGDSTQTKVSTHYTIAGKNIFMRSILFLSKSYMKSSDMKMLESLKKTIESRQ